MPRATVQGPTCVREVNKLKFFGKQEVGGLGMQYRYILPGLASVYALKFVNRAGGVKLLDVTARRILVGSVDLLDCGR